MKKISKLILLTLILGLLLTACGSKDLLIGSWNEPVSGISMQFNEDGSMVMSMNGTAFTMTYEKQDPNILVIKASTDGSIPDQTMTYTAGKDKLTLTVDGTDTIFQRVK
jgi:major membrane immunogen (membrane-anchored lipoprotein)